MPLGEYSGQNDNEEMSWKLNVSRPNVRQAFAWKPSNRNTFSFIRRFMVNLDS